MQSIGDNDDTVESSSAEIMQTEEGFAPVFFDPRPLANLLLIDELESLSPVLDMQVRQYCSPASTRSIFMHCNAEDVGCVWVHQFCWHFIAYMCLVLCLTSNITNSFLACICAVSL